jgi:hypothetical protein
LEEIKMIYGIEYQFLPKGAARPTDDGEIVGISATDATGTVLLPNVGDFVNIDNSADGGERSSFSGRVRSRLFNYIRTHDDIHCFFNIVVEETDDDWSKLLKQ